MRWISKITADLPIKDAVAEHGGSLALQFFSLLLLLFDINVSLDWDNTITKPSAKIKQTSAGPSNDQTARQNGTEVKAVVQAEVEPENRKSSKHSDCIAIR